MAELNGDAFKSAAEHAVVRHNVVGMHVSADPSSPLSSQMVSGARVVVLERGGDAMAFVEGEDRYRGWVRESFLTAPIDRSDSPATTIATLIADIYSSPTAASQLVTKLTVATPVYLGRHSSERDFTPVLMPSGATGYTHRINLSSTYQRLSGTRPSTAVIRPAPPSSGERQRVLSGVLAHIPPSALRMVGTPYLWGGATPFGIDCSGLTQLAYRISGVQLLRDAAMQISDRRFAPVLAGEDMATAPFEPADLLFFRGVSDHVGIAIGDGAFVHAAGKERGVIVSACDDDEWTKIYVGARRLLPHSDLSIDRA